ncbi:S8 family serine peptidase [Egicoccus sp. AB-alg2]|uniref:S8 family serine peptidase n=1 Tax=Egicoccus sp. AB-alg2 TaxID=3242693 RepID=UPI00359E0FFE
MSASLPRARRTLVTLTVASLLLATVPAHASDGPSGDEATERIVVAYEPGAVRNAVAATSGSVADDIDELGVEVLEVPTSEAANTLRRLRQDRRVRYVEPDVAVFADTVTPNDPLWAEQWGQQRIGAPAAWRRTTGKGSVVVAVLDSGVDAQHADLRGAVLTGRSFVNGTTSTADDNGHGTAAAGLVAARGNNRIGVAGMCWECKVLPVKVLDRTGSGTTSSVAKGLVWAADQGAQVASLSLSSTGSSQTLNDAITYARSKGMLVVASAGNAGTTEVRYPAGHKHVLAVAGSTNSDGRYSWSNYGSWVDVAAPGCNVTTQRGGGYSTFCGTSSATPLVAGTAALAFSANPAATPDQVRDAVQRSTVKVSFSLGAGRIRADATLDRLTAPIDTGTPVNESPTGTASPADSGTARSIANACPGDGATYHSWAEVHAPGIECLEYWGIGIFPLTNYRPSRALTRGEFAALLDRTLNATEHFEQPTKITRFPDTRGHRHEAAIERLNGLGVIEGYKDGTFGPDRQIRRDQMATLMTRVVEQRYGLQLTAPKGMRFTDMPTSSPHASSVAKLAGVGITSGVDSHRYRPAGMVTRAQTATFIARSLDLLVVEGAITAR